MALAAAIRGTETVYRFASFANYSCNRAFFSFIGLFVEHFYDFRCVIVEKVVNVPKSTLLFSKMTFYTLFQIVLRRTNISV